MYRFSERKSIKNVLSGVRLSILIFIVLFILFLYLLSGITDDTRDRQEASLNSAINRCIVSCYCVEGTYPPSLDYILQHYGLTYDKSVFFVDYRALGSNIYPDVTIIRKGAAHE